MLHKHLFCDPHVVIMHLHEHRMVIIRTKIGDEGLQAAQTKNNCMENNPGLRSGDVASAKQIIALTGNMLDSPVLQR